MDKPVLFVCKDPGGMNGIVPVYDAWLRSGYGDAVLVANGKAVELLSAQGRAFRYYPTPDAVLADIGIPAALVTSICTKGGIGRDLVPVLKGRCPTIAVQDYWSAPFRTGGAWDAPDCRPDFMTVGDRFGAAVARVGWEEGERDGLIVEIGFPALDACVALDRAAATRGVEERFGCSSSSFVVLFMGQMAGTTKILQTIVAELERIPADRFGGDVVLLLRAHPRMRNDAPDEAERWDAFLWSARLSSGIRISDASGTDDPLPCLARADVVISTMSSALVTAAALQRTPIVFLPPEERERYLAATGGALNEFPLVTMGCAWKATTAEELAAAIVRVRSDDARSLARTQESALHLDGRNAERIAAFVAERIREYRNS